VYSVPIDTVTTAGVPVIVAENVATVIVDGVKELPVLASGGHDAPPIAWKSAVPIFANDIHGEPVICS
jgi:hypothetical protein